MLSNDIASEVDRAITEESRISKRIASHILNKENPHEVTAGQLNLDKVDNTSDKDKPVSEAQQAALDKKVDKTAVATTSTLGLVKSGTDITVDSNGNVSVNDNSHSHTVSNISNLTATAAELNVLDGITASTEELNFVDGVTGNIQTQLDSKAPMASPTLTGIPKAPTASAGTSTTQIATTAFTQTAVSNHNTSPTAHDDIRSLITNLTTRLNTLADSDDTTLDQLSEIVAYIKNNKSLIDSITTSKVNVSDIIDNLTSTATNKPLSAKQGKVLKDLIDTLTTIVGEKVDKISGKGLSANDYTTEEKNKLAGIATGAEVNVQPDWNATDTNSDAYIKNKPTSLPASDVSAWAKADTKPTYTKSEVGLGNVPNVTTNDQAPTFTQASARTNITSGEKLSTIFGKIMKWFADLKTVAFSGSYTDLSDKPTIPSVGNGTLTIQKNGTNVQTFTANQSGNATANITVPTKTSELTNDSGFKTTDTTYGVVSKTADGLVPKLPNETTTTKYLRQDGTWTVPPDTNTTYSAATTGAAGLMSAADKTKLDGIATGANAYSLPLATASVRGGVKTGYSANGKNYPVQLSNEQMYVNVPWTDNNTWKANSSSSEGYVASGSGQANKVWKTDANGNPGWRDDADTVYTHPNTSGNKHIPAGGSSGQILRWSSDGTAVWGNDNNTTYSAMGGASASANGTAGLVPAPAAGAQAKYLRGDGTWQTPTNTTYGAATTASAGLMSAADKTKLDGIDTSANAYSLPLATSSVRGGAKIGYTANGKNYPVQLSNEQMYVNVPWTDNNTTYTAGNQLELSGTQFHMSDACETIDNWNNVITNGFYMAYNAANAPVSGAWFYGIVIVHNANYARQILYRFADGSNLSAGQGKRYERVRDNGVWNSWTSTSPTFSLSGTTLTISF